MEFDEAYWAKVIKKPTWYIEFTDFANDAKRKLEPESQAANQLNKRARHFFEDTLEKGQVALAACGPDLDKERKPIDTIVIHHTSAQPGYRLSYLNAVHLLNIYAPYFTNPTIRGEENLKGQPVWSGHFKKGEQVFWGYHWLLRMDGEFIRLLDDAQIGWHAGSWEINRRSIGICLDNDYEVNDPDNELLRQLAAFINKDYPEVEPINIIGHCEAKETTSCPGKNWIGGWKNKLAGYLSE